MLEIARSFSFLFVFTVADRTSPSLDLFTAWMNPLWPLGTVSSTTRTTSPGFNDSCIWFHFDRCCNVGRYSCNHFFQNTSDMYWIWRHQRREYASFLLKSPEGRGILVRPWRSMAGVIDASPRSLDDVSGRSFKMRSTSAIKHWRDPSVRVCCPINPQLEGWLREY